MNDLEIAERLVAAAEIEDRLPAPGPKRLKAQQLPYVHTNDDMKGWGKRPGERDFLRREDADRHATHRREFWEQVPSNARAMSEAEEAWGWLALVEDDDARAALAAWARCMADHKRQFFQDWCRSIGISREAGRRRKNRALAIIRAHLARSDMQNSDNGPSLVLHRGTENGHIADTTAAVGDDEEGRRAWHSDRAFTSLFSNEAADFSWATKRWERRRRREAEKAKKRADSKSNRVANV